MKQKLYLIAAILFLLSARTAKADVPTLSGTINRSFPWYSYVVLGAFLIIVVSISMVFLAKIKYRKKKDEIQNQPNTK